MLSNLSIISRTKEDCVNSFITGVTGKVLNSNMENNKAWGLYDPNFSNNANKDISNLERRSQHV